MDNIRISNRVYKYYKQVWEKYVVRDHRFSQFRKFLGMTNADQIEEAREIFNECERLHKAELQDEYEKFKTTLEERERKRKANRPKIESRFIPIRVKIKED